VYALQDSGQFDDCIRVSHSIRNTDLGYAMAHGLGYQGKRMYSNALSELHKAKDLGMDAGEVQAEIADVYLASGQLQQHVRYNAQLMHSGERCHSLITPFSFAFPRAARSYHSERNVFPGAAGGSSV
jgi:hypothetical protein